MQNPASVPSSHEVIERAIALASKLADRAPECEKLRCVPEMTRADFIDAGLHKTLLPRRYGGWGMSMDTHVAIAMELGKGDGSQAWALSSFGDQTQLIGAFETKAQDEIWGDDPAALACTSLEPEGVLTRTNGGYLVSGKWLYASGIDHAQWLLAIGFVQEGEHRRRVYFLAPKSAAEIVDDCQSVGLAGAGSKSFTLHDVFVPAHRVLDEEHINQGTGPGARAGLELAGRFPRQGASLALASVALGIAHTMIEDLVLMASDPKKRGPRAQVNFSTALRVAESKAEVDAACLSVTAAVRETVELLARGETPTAERRVLNSLKSGYAVMTAVRAGDRVFSAAGAKAIFLTNRLPRCLYDIHAIAAHESFGWEANAAGYGKLRLGDKT